jgi:predicted DNA-binding transcriptional regulator AlpA
MNTVAKKILTIDEVSAETGVPVSTLRWYRAKNTGGPKSFRLAGRVVYRREHVEAWIAEQETATSRG